MWAKEARNGVLKGREHVIDTAIDAITTTQHHGVARPSAKRLPGPTRANWRGEGKGNCGVFHRPGAPHLRQLMRGADNAKLWVLPFKREDVDSVGAATGAHRASHHNDAVATFHKTRVPRVLDGSVNPIVSVLTPLGHALTYQSQLCSITLSFKLL